MKPHQAREISPEKKPHLAGDAVEEFLLRRLGGGEERPNRPPGKIVLSRGLRRLLDYLALEAILAEEERQHGGLPPRIAAMLGRTPVQ